MLQVVRCLLINPFPESALNDEAGKLFMEDYDEYCKKVMPHELVHNFPVTIMVYMDLSVTQSPVLAQARMYTEVHARTKSSTEPAEDGVDGEPGTQNRLARCYCDSFAYNAAANLVAVEKRQKPVESKATEKQRAAKKKSLKRL